MSDALAQRLAGRQLRQIDPRRLLRAATIGASFGPLTHAYYEFSDTILPPYDATNVPWKILMDQTAYAAFKYSLYIAAVGVLSGHSGPTVRADVSAKIVPTLQTGWRFWPMCAAGR